MFGRRTQRKRERDFNERWGDLARYNAEITRGIAHTPEYDALMAAKQAEWNAEAYRRLRVVVGVVGVEEPNVTATRENEA